MLLDIIQLSFKKIKNRILESIVVIISLAFGLAIVSTVMGLIISFNQDMEDNKNDVWRRQISLSPSKYDGYNEDDQILKKLGSIDMGEPIHFTREKMDEIQTFCPSVDYVFIHNWFRLNDNAPEDVDWWVPGLSIGCENVYFDFAGLELETGSLFTQDDIDNANNVVVLGGNLKKVLFKDEDAIGKQLTFNDVEYTVIGVLKEDYNKNLSKTQLEDYKDQPWEKNNLHYIPISKVPWISGNTTFEYITLGVDDFDDMEKAVKEVKLYIEDEYPDGEVLITSALDATDKINESTIKVLMVVGLIAFIALIIAALTNLNLMLARIIREKKGLGISIALGSSKKTLFTSLVTEATIIGAIGAILGLIITYFLNIALKEVMENGGAVVSATFSIENILINLGVALIITAIFSIIPALEAIKVSPSQVLRED